MLNLRSINEVLRYYSGLDGRDCGSLIQLLSWFVTMNILEQSPHQSFQITQLAPSVVICARLGGDS